MRRPRDSSWCPWCRAVNPILNSTVTRDHEARLGVICQVTMDCGHTMSVVRTREKANA